MPNRWQKSLGAVLDLLDILSVPHTDRENSANWLKLNLHFLFHTVDHFENCPPQSISFSSSSSSSIYRTIFSASFCIFYGYCLFPSSCNDDHRTVFVLTCCMLKVRKSHRTERQSSIANIAWEWIPNEKCIDVHIWRRYLRVFLCVVSCEHKCSKWT